MADLHLCTSKSIVSSETFMHLIEVVVFNLNSAVRETVSKDRAFLQACLSMVVFLI